MDKSLVSVVIPVYNADRYLGEAIGSVLIQDYQPIEIIVIDDGSTDNSKNIVLGYGSKAQYYYQKHSGQAVARNFGASLAHGHFLAFLDADDIWAKGKLSMQLAVLDAQADLDVVFGHVKQFVSPEIELSTTNEAHFSDKIMAGHLPGTMVIKRDVFLRTGGFDPRYRVGEFIDWYTRAKEQGIKGLMLPDVLLSRRLHGNNLGIRQRDAQSDYILIFKAFMDRQRKENNQDVNK